MNKLAIATLLLLTATAPGAFAGNTVAGDAERGRRLHTGEETVAGVPACNTCHGKDGNQTQAPTFPRLAGQYSDYLVHSLEAYKSGARKNAVMQPMASALSKKDMDDLATYFGSLTGDLEGLEAHID